MIGSPRAGSPAGRRPVWVAGGRQDGGVRVDLAPVGAELKLLGQYLDCQRETVLLKASGLTHEQMTQVVPMSALTLAGLLTTSPLWRTRGCTTGSWCYRRWSRGIRWTGTPNRTGTSALRRSKSLSSCASATARHANAAGWLSRSPRSRAAVGEAQARRAALLAAVGPAAPDRGDRAPRWARRPAARVHRRHGGRAARSVALAVIAVAAPKRSR